jgi:hypothetical protein
MASDFTLGLDLGQTSDPSALAILKSSIPTGEGGAMARDHRGGWLLAYDCVHLERFPLGTSYPAIIARVEELVANPKLGSRPRMVIDATGVGRPVVDLFLNQRMAAELAPLTITAGFESRQDRWNNTHTRAYWVPKLELASTVQALLQMRRLKVVPRLDLAETLKRELLDFQVKVTAAANETFGAWREGAHDDLVLAVAMAAWVAERQAARVVTPTRDRPDLAALKQVAMARRAMPWLSPFPVRGARF